MIKSRTALVHLSFWITYIAIVIFCYGYNKNDWGGYVYETTISHIISAGVFYTTALLIFPKFWDKKKYTISILLLILILSASILLRFLFAFVISPKILNTTLYVFNIGKDELIVKFFFQWFTFSLYSLGYWQATKRISAERKLKERIAEAAIQQKLELENAALRAQINPHFIFNSLEHFRSQTADVDPATSYGIGCFMQILSAGIITPGADGKIALAIETNAIEGTIFIFKQRFPNINLSYISKIKDDLNIRILPHILLPFVENAFKHGAYDDKDNKIRIEFFADDTVLKLFVFNKKGVRIKDQSTGIGIAYVKRHLESGYKNKHDLIIHQTDENFTIDLTVQLN